MDKKTGQWQYKYNKSDNNTDINRKIDELLDF
jgi:hypothetical protein